MQSRYYNPETGRFLNADIFASTGQGLLGNNMFAYCGNDPFTNFDPAGSYYASAEERITTGCGGRGGIPGSPVKRPIQNTEDDSKLNEELDYIANEDEQVVLDAEYVAFYRGIPVVKLPIGTDAFSLGRGQGDGSPVPHLSGYSRSKITNSATISLPIRVGHPSYPDFPMPASTKTSLQTL